MIARGRRQRFDGGPTPTGPGVLLYAPASGGGRKQELIGLSVSADAEFLRVEAGRREAQGQLVQLVYENLRDGEITKPRPICRDDVPRRMRGAAAGEHGPERFLIGVPLLALLEVVGVELPVFGR